MLIRLNSDGPSGAQLYVVNGAAVTGYTVTNDIDWGNAVWQHVASGPRGTQGARPATGAPDNRVVSIPIHIGPTGSVDSCNLKAALLVEIVDELRRFGGTILWQATSQGFRQFFKVMDAGVTKQSWGRKGAIVDTADCVILADCAPYMLGDPMDTRDSFASDSIGSGDYTRDAASSGSLSVSGGQVVPSATGLKVYRHTAKGYTYGDVQVTIKVRTGSTLTNGTWGLIARADTAGAGTYIAGEIVAGTNVIRVGTYFAGVAGSLSTAAFTPLANTTYWIRLRLEGRLYTCEVFTSAPTPVSTPVATVSNVFWPPKHGVGHAGIRITTADTAERYDDLAIEPYTYRLANAPEQIQLGGQIPGDVPALCDLTITPQGGAATPIWGMAAWLERPLIANLCWNGDFDDATIGTSGWSGAAVTGVLASGTSTLSRITTAGLVKYGAGALQIATPATTDTGASFLMPRRFKSGRVYMALVWASSAAGTTSSRIKLGTNGDVATGTAAALSATPKVYSVIWTPTADRDSAVVAFGVNAATATNIVIDGGVVVELQPVALAAAITSTGQATMTVYITPSDLPNLQPDGSISNPFLAVIDQEIVQVNAVNLVTNVWNIDRGVEGSTAATHLIDAVAGVLPPLRPQLEGKGAQPPFGVIEADSYVPALSSPGAGTFTANTADANARGGTVLRWTPGTSGAQTATLVYFIDPALLVPDDYTLGEIDIEVYLRQLWATSLTGLKVTLSAQPEGGSTFGGERFTRVPGNIGKLLTLAGAKVARQHLLGAVPMIVDRANPQRWRLKVSLSCTGGATPTWDFDHFMLAATRYRLASPTGEINDTASASGGYPDFIPYDAAWGGSSAMSKLMRSDMSAAIAAPGGYVYPDVGLGRVLEMPDSDVDLLVKVSNLVPDDPTIDSSAETSATTTTSAHAAMTPRYQLARSS